MRGISGRVVWVSPDSYTVAINKGVDDGVYKGMKFLVFRVGDELFDPVTKKSLGRLELVNGEGVVVNVQEKISTIQSLSVEIHHKRTIQRPSVNSFLMMAKELDEPEEKKLPFKDVGLDCIAKLIAE